MSKGSGGEPRIGVFVCHCGINIGGIVDVPQVVECAKTLPEVAYSEANLFTCSSEGLSKIKQAIEKHNLNKVVVASCTPRTHEPLFRATCEEAGVNKYLFEMANIRDQCSWVHMREPEKATEKAKDIVRMAVAKARLLQPQEEPEITIEPAAMVIGGGVAGMSAASCLAGQGFKVHLIERRPELGGMLRHLHKLFSIERDASEILGRITTAVRDNEKIDVRTSTVVKEVKGFIGNFKVTIQGEKGKADTLTVGTIIVATGADTLKPVGKYGYGEYQNVITQLELEELLKERKLEKIETFVMIQCVGSREKAGRAYCSRVCCTEAVKNAILIKEFYPDVNGYIIYRDLQTYGKEYEALDWKGREAGIRLVRYLPERPPDVALRPDGKLNVKVYHAIFGEEISIDSDLVILSTPLVQHEDAEELSRLLKVPLGPDKFFMEAHVKLRPVDFATDGIYVCGTAHSPKDVAESIDQAYAAASKASIPLALGTMRTEAIMSVVDERLCSGCGTCISICPFGAMEKDENGVARTREALCKGCGVCAASCPEKAIAMRHFTDEQIIAQVHAAVSR